MRKSTSPKVPGISKTIPAKYSEVNGLEKEASLGEQIQRKIT